MLKNPFYYGKFEYPVTSGNWYQGDYPPLITKEVFDKVQEKIVAREKVKYGSKTFTYKGLLKCAGCKSTIIGDSKFRERKYGPSNFHIYYHCARKINDNCHEPYISEEELERSLLRLINFMYIAHHDELVLTDRIQESMETFKKVREGMLLQQDINPNSRVWDIRDYARYVLTNKSSEEKRGLFNLFSFPLFIQNRNITSLRAH